MSSTAPQVEWTTDDLIRDFLHQQTRPAPPSGPHRRRTPIIIEHPDGSTSVVKP